MATRFLLESRYGAMFDNKATPVSIGELVVNVMSLGVILVAEVEPGGPRWTQGADPSPAIVGMIAIVVLPHPLSGVNYAEEVAWWVEPEYRDGTLGPRMLRSAEEWATRNRANVVKMVAPAGSDVGRFLEKVGYQAVETAYIKSV